jgi:Flp pilus assembly protein TadD
MTLHRKVMKKAWPCTQMTLRAACSLSVALLLAACGMDFTGSTAHGDSYEVAVRQADSARTAGDAYTAIALYGRALQAEPEGPEARQGLGETYLMMGASEEAAAQFRDLLAHRPSDQAARRGLASALIAMNQPELAQQQLEMALQADARDYRALNALGVVLDMQGRHADAQREYRRGIGMAPDFAALRSNFGLSLAICGEAGQAIDVLAPLASRSAADVRIRQNLAFAYVMAGDFEKALQLGRQDLPEPQAQRELSDFMRLRSLSLGQRSVEIRRSPYFFSQARGNEF